MNGRRFIPPDPLPEPEAVRRARQRREVADLARALSGARVKLSIAYDMNPEAVAIGRECAALGDRLFDFLAENARRAIARAKEREDAT